MLATKDNYEIICENLSRLDSGELAFAGKSVCELAKQYGLSRSNMNEKRHRVLAKLLKFIENEK